jgi:predicted PurR-regulated permease PerM
MTDQATITSHQLEERVFVFLVIAVSLAFIWILRPFLGAVLWSVILAIMFQPLYQRLCRAWRHRRTAAAIGTVFVILVLVILPLTLLTMLLVQEGLGTYQRIQSRELDVGRYLQQVFDALPTWVTNLLDRIGLTSLRQVQERVTSGLTRSLQFLGTQALSIGQNAFEFVVSLAVMLYLLFFLLRDGDGLSRRMRAAIPLRPEPLRSLAERFATVIRATVKGNVIVALVQGALGGLILSVLGIGGPVLWGALMAVLSLLPAIGAALVWLPVALYLLVSGAVWKGVVLIAYGMLVIGLIDNILRPILVGKDTQMPDYLVLISTLGGIAAFGVNGFILGPVIAALFITTWDIVSASRAERGLDRGLGTESSIPDRVRH